MNIVLCLWVGGVTFLEDNITKDEIQRGNYFFILLYNYLFFLAYNKGW